MLPENDATDAPHGPTLSEAATELENKEQLSLNDRLAIDRTMLAHERTFLSYLRTAIAMVIAGLTFIRLFDDPWLVNVGYILIPVGCGIFFHGVRKRRKLRSFDLELEL